jgi:hypothetical protein
LLGPGGFADPIQVEEQSRLLRARNEEQLDPESSWARFIGTFGLSEFEADTCLLALAPEVELKYEVLYAYLNNDVTRKWPTRDLAFRLFHNPSDRLDVWSTLSPGGTLFRSGLLRSVTPGGDRASMLAGGFAPAATLIQHLLGGADATLEEPLRRLLPDLAETHVPRTLLADLGRSAALLQTERHPPTLVFEGHARSGRRSGAQRVSAQMGSPLICVDAADLQNLDNTARKHVLLTAQLKHAVLLIENLDVLVDTEKKIETDLARWLNTALDSGVRLIISCAPGTPWREILAGRRAISHLFEPLPFEERITTWSRALTARGISTDPATLRSVAQQFKFSAGQVEAAVQRAADQPGGTAREGVLSAARAESSCRLGKLAVKVQSAFQWSDLILPAATIRHVKEVVSAIENRHCVGLDWGMRPGFPPLSLNILFSGPSGTGKTMTAGIIASHLGLDLYRCDLSGIISKYIGETEKNLDKIFDVAAQSNAILFFDEADALFGRRSEVRDAHDRYANIEVSYLLQKLEQHDGVVILATNLSKNIDDAFARRVQFAVEFPVPAEPDRERLWRSMFPDRAPLDPGCDIGFLARQFAMTGGQIRNVSVDAAFLAAADGQRITMPLLVKAVGRQLLKQGRMPSASDFGQYWQLLNDGG